MTSQPAIPTLIFMPDNSYLDYTGLYAVATAYAHSGLVISDHGKKADRPEFSFPAVVCSSFAIELFLKFFLMLDKAEDVNPPEKHEYGHHISKLWNKIRPKHQALIAGMFRNKTGKPLLNASDSRIELFEEALSHVGDAPFVKWRYVHEFVGPTFMSHAAINEVLDALGYAADYVMKEKSVINRDSKKTPEEDKTATDQEDQGNDGTLIKIRGSENLLLGRDSALRRIPVNINPKQAIFLDGIRHSVEFMDVTYSRLRDALTDLALNPPASNKLPDIFSHILLDAWAFVDAVDRFRIMYMQMPGINFSSKRDDIPTLQESTQEFQNLRRIAEYLDQRADLVVSQNGTAFGELSWLTGVQLQPEVIAWYCSLRPGTLWSEPAAAAQTNPIVSTLDWPTDSIRLSAGGFQGNLSEVRIHIAMRIRHLEAQLQDVFQQPAQTQVPVINDMFMRRPVKRQDKED